MFDYLGGALWIKNRFYYSLFFQSVSKVRVKSGEFPYIIKGLPESQTIWELLIKSQFFNQISLFSDKL